MSKIIAVSGSPIPNSNTDRLVRAVLEASEQEYEMIKLSDYQVGPCRGCKGCAGDNICKVKDDFPMIAEKVKEADALVVGAYTPYGMVDGFTKAFLERLWSMRHQNTMNKGKKAVTIVSSLMPEIAEMVHRSIGMELQMEQMDQVGAVTVNGNAPCLTCGNGDDCANSVVKMVHGDVPCNANSCTPVEDQPVYEEAKELGRKLGALLA